MLDRAFDLEYAKTHGIVCGTDEAGRGPLCGPVTAAAVVLPDGFELEGLDDSKKLTDKFRPTLLNALYASALMLICLTQMNKVVQFLYFQF